MIRSTESREKKTTKAPRKAKDVASQASAKRIVEPKTVVVADPAPTTQSRTPVTEERIRERAYLKWEAAGRPGGDGLNFWLEAQQELLQET